MDHIYHYLNLELTRVASTDPFPGFRVVAALYNWLAFWPRAKSLASLKVSLYIDVNLLSNNTFSRDIGGRFGVCLALWH